MLFDDGWLRTSHRRMNQEERKEKEGRKERGFREIFLFHPLHP